MLVSSGEGFKYSGGINLHIPKYLEGNIHSALPQISKNAHDTFVEGNSSGQDVLTQKHRSIFNSGFIHEFVPETISPKMDRLLKQSLIVGAGILASPKAFAGIEELITGTNYLYPAVALFITAAVVSIRQFPEKLLPASLHAWGQWKGLLPMRPFARRVAEEMGKTISIYNSLQEGLKTFQKYIPFLTVDDIIQISYCFRDYGSFHDQAFVYWLLVGFTESRVDLSFAERYKLTSVTERLFIYDNRTADTNRRMAKNFYLTDFLADFSTQPDMLSKMNPSELEGYLKEHLSTILDMTSLETKRAYLRFFVNDVCPKIDNQKIKANMVDEIKRRGWAEYYESLIQKKQKPVTNYSQTIKQTNLMQSHATARNEQNG